jgi:S1-C subfamily serine protease
MKDALKVTSLIGLAAMVAGPSLTLARDQDVREAIVKIYSVHDRPNYYNPWASYGPRRSTGSGCVVVGHRILTNAHVVEDQTFLQVRRNGDAKRYQAHLIAVSHEADLALLSVEDERFFEGVEPLEYGTLPNTEDEVLVYGFPLGGDTLSITKGVLSRIEHQTYAHSSCEFLAGQLDAAINPGNSGGPVIVDDRIVGVVMQSISSADNIGYMVPPPILRHFLEDLEDGSYDNFPSMGVVLQDMENPSLKARFNVDPDESGVLVTRVLPGSPAEGVLEVGDVITSVDGHDVADDGTIEFRPKQRTKVSYVVQLRQVGGDVGLTLLREGQPMEITLRLNRSLRKDWLIPMEVYDVLPTYFIYGGVVFCPLTKNLLREYGSNWYNKAPKEFVALLGDNFRKPDQDEAVIVLKVLAADVNEGYHNVGNWIVTEVDGQSIRNLRHLIELVEQPSDQPYTELRSASGHILVMDRAKVAATADEILALYRIGSDRSPDLMSPEPAPERAEP